MNTVWLPNPIEKDISSARKYGTVQAIVLSFVPTPVGIAEIEATLNAKAKPGDVLVMAGNPIYIAHAYATLLKKFGSVRCLTWDRRAVDYVHNTVP